MTGQKLKLAVIDDDRTSLAMLGDPLVEAGHSVITFRSAEEALAGLWDSPVDAAVIDLLLPAMSGADLAAELRRRPWARSIPLVAVTALAWSRFEIERFESSFAPAKVLPKPVSPEMLVGTLEALWRQRQAGPWAPEAPTAKGTTLTATAAPAPSSVPTELEVSLQTPSEILEEFTQNLVHDGLFVRSYAPLPAQAPVRVSLRVPFRAAPVVLTGKVVHAVEVDSPQARLQGPGMAIALADLPRDLKREFQAYVTGLRAGAPSAPPSRTLRTLVMIGMEGRLPRETSSFLGRYDLKPIWVPSVYQALMVVRTTPQCLVVLAGDTLGDDPLGTIWGLEHAGAAWIAAVADAAMKEALGARIHVVDASLPPLSALEELSRRLAYAPRASARVQVRSALRAQRVDGPLRGTVENLSLGGLMMRTEGSLAIGEKVHVDFELPGGGRIQGEVRALRVCRARGETSELSIAARFDRIEVDSVETLRRFIDAHAGAASSRRFVTPTPTVPLH